MTKAEYLETLRNGLSDIKAPDIDNRLSFYEEMIDDRMEDGMSEEEAVNSMEDISEILDSVLLEKSVPALVAKKVKNKKEEAEKKGLGIIWLILAIIGFPIWLPLLIVFFTLILVFYIVFAVIIASLFITVGAIGLSGIGCILIPFFAFKSMAFSTTLGCVGAAIVLIGLSILLFRPLCFISKALFSLFNACLRKIKTLFIK